MAVKSDFQVDLKTLKEGVELIKQFTTAIEEVDDYEIDVIVSQDNFISTVETLVNYGVTHLITIIVIDMEDSIDLLYPFSIIYGKNKSGKIVIRVKLDSKKPEILSLCKLIPGTHIYEREVYDFVGVNFINHPDLRRILTPDDFPNDVFPLLKRYSVEELKQLAFHEKKEEEHQ